MRIAIVHNAVTGESNPDDRDVLDQVAAVSAAFTELGHEPVAIPCTLDLASLSTQLRSLSPDMAFNIVESLEGHGCLIHLVPALLDALRIPYTGAGTEAMFVTSNKIAAKERMCFFDLKTPAWIGPYPAIIPTQYRTVADDDRCRNAQWLIKSQWEHASIGLDEDELITGSDSLKIESLLKSNASRLGGACFAEMYIDGREFNISIMNGEDGRPKVLPPAEIIFEGYSADKPKIVGYRAKWMQDSYEYHHTPRRFDFSPKDTPLIDRLKERTLKCWQCFGLNGYARVDFRVDAQNELWILEINTNPCLTPDAGFAAAISQAGIPYAEAIRRIIR